MFPSTHSENFRSWDRFLDAYYGPIRTALRLMPFVGEGLADDISQSFFLKMYERNLLENPVLTTGRFRNWLLVAARHHALDEWRKSQRRPERSNAIATEAAVDHRLVDVADQPFDADECYALSILHMAVDRVRKHLIKEDRSDLWLIFDELVVAPLIPGREIRSRQEVLAMFPGQGSAFLDNRLTTVKRLFRRILPTLIPVSPTESLSSDERVQEVLQILQSSNNLRLWVALLTKPVLETPESANSSLDLSQSRVPPTTESADLFHDELKILLGFWLEIPMHEYLVDLEEIGPALATAILDARPSALYRNGRGGQGSPLTIGRLISANDPLVSSIPSQELVMLLRQLKRFAKHAYRASGRGQLHDAPRSAISLETSLPGEVAQILYNLAGALSLTRCGVRIIGIDDARFRKNIAWVLDQRWLATELRPTFLAALHTLDASANS